MDRDRAVADGHRIARFLEHSGARSVVGIGSTFDPERPFSDSFLAWMLGRTGRPDA